MINFEDFQKIDLRVGKIIVAEKVEGSEKLLKLQVDLGVEIGPRQIIAGIAQVYQPEEMAGKQIVVIVNLEPKIIKGLESQGMLLAADDGQPVLLTPDKPIANGAKAH
ncbi:MAG: methionine--tRNA ligase subunit beta [Candidatus Gribaldobacteria bacterium]|nr:methionine--tRNA ligase subunit beta [Candidatus Gribaldobacteria bacterium]